MPNATTPAFAVSSWSLHRRIGLAYPDRPGKPATGIAEPVWGKGEVSILDLPTEVKAHGIDRLEICHFQLASRDPGYLAEMRVALARAGVTLQTLLIDDGDLSHPEPGATGRRKSARANSAEYSSSVRSAPPVKSITCRSSQRPGPGVSSTGTGFSSTSTRASGRMARRIFCRIFAASSSA